MNEDNSDHYKYMPKGAPMEDPTAPMEVPSIRNEEMIVSEEEIAIPEHVTDDEEVSEAKPEMQVPGFSSQESPIWVQLIYGFFSPLLVPTFICLLAFLLSVIHLVAPDAVLPYSLTVFGATCVVPFIALYVLMRVGAVRSFDLFSPRERVVPYVIEIMALGGVTLFFIFKGAYAWIWTLYCGATAVAIANFLINFRMRISTHCSAMAALVAALIVINNSGIPQSPLFWWLVGAVFFTGLIGTLSMTQGKHTLWEVLTGYATGFLGIILFSLIR